MSASKMVRRVMRTFEVRQVTEDNAIELALWLRDAGKELNAAPGGGPLVTFDGEKPALVPDVFMSGASATVPVGSWIGWGWPTRIPEGDIARPRLLVLADGAIEDETDDQGIEVVRR